MTKLTLTTALVAIILPAALPAQTLSDLLQKGIYTQETLGDLDAAIKIYRQIVSTAKDAHNFAAQAQYRLGLCLLQKGDQPEAVKAFQQLIKDYPEQTDLVAKAREYASADLKLLPTPWTDGEVLELKLHLQAGLYLGAIYVSIDAAGANTELIQSRTYTTNFGQLGYSQVEVDRDTFLPLRRSFRHSLLGQVDVQYQPKLAQLVTKGKEGVKTIELSGPTYDNEQWWYLMRRLPLAPGFKIALTDMGPLGNLIDKLGMEVTGEEDVQVPAGKFHCYKVEIPMIKQTFWITTDGSRYPVKFEANSAVGELSAIRHADPSAPSVYQNTRLGFSLTMPSGWVVDDGENAAASEFSLLDPAVVACTTLAITENKKDVLAVADELRTHAGRDLQNRKSMLQNFKPRPEGLQPRLFAGQAALAHVADYTDQGKNMVEYTVWVRGENLRAAFTAHMEASDFDGLRARLDPIIESLKLR